MPTCLISAVTAFHLIREGCEAYLASIMDTAKVSPGVKDVPVVRDFLDVFLDKLPGLPPYRKLILKLRLFQEWHQYQLLLIEWHQRS